MKQRRFLMICFAALLCLGMASLSSVAYAADFPSAYSGGNSSVNQEGNTETFLQNGPPATICIDKSKFSTNATPYIPQGSSFRRITSATGNGNLVGKVGYVGSLNMNADNAFTGTNDWFSYRFTDGAILADGTRADVVLTYSNIHIYTPGQDVNGRDYRWNGSTWQNLTYNGTTSIAQGTRVFISNNVDIHIGIKVTATFTIVKSGTDEIVPGSFYYTMYDIDVQRNPSNGANYTYLYGAESNYNYSEQVTVNSGAQTKVYVPTGYKSGIVGGNGSDGNGVTILPAGYSDPDPGTFVTEFGVLADAAGFELSVGGSGGAIFNGQYNSIQSNLLPEAVGALYAEKNVDTTGATPTDLTRNWSMETTISGQTTTESIGNGQIEHVGNFIKGKSFTFKETDPDLANYETTYEVLNGSSLTNQTTQSSGSGVTANGTMVCVNTVKFTNRRLWQNLAIGKEVRGARGDRTKQWKFTLTVKDSPQNGGAPLTGATLFDGVDGRPSALPAGWTEEGNGVFTFDLAHNGTTTISLPKGCQYTITEEIDPYYLQTGSASGTLSSDTTETLVNDFQGKTLTVSKTVEAGDRTWAWQYTLTLLNPSGAPYTTLTAETLGYTGDGWDDSGKANGVYKFTLKHGESGTFTLPVDSRYTVTEESDERYTQTHVIDSGATVTGVSTGSQTLSDDATVAYNNRKDKMNLTVSKAVDGSIGSRSKYFKVVITVANAGDTVCWNWI